MCDVRVVEQSSRWFRRFPCARSGKYEAVVKNERGRGDDVTLTIHVCKQHLNAISRGDWVTIRYDVGEGSKEDSFKGTVTELGEVESNLKRLKEGARYNQNSIELRKKHIGRSAALVLDELLELTEGVESLKDFHDSLVYQKNAYDTADKLSKEIGALEHRVREIKENL